MTFVCAFFREVHSDPPLPLYILYIIIFVLSLYFVVSHVTVIVIACLFSLFVHDVMVIIIVTIIVAIFIVVLIVIVSLSCCHCHYHHRCCCCQGERLGYAALVAGFTPIVLFLGPVAGTVQGTHPPTLSHLYTY